MVWDSDSEKGALLSSGLYFVRITTENGSFTKKVVLQR
ncbi:MAG: T9SS type A sorting domain-containing protein [Bacteroidetes bacterium]|nr:T9SS type A sorting domain-containing protein [Bacteroidota bacterium]